jgi:hypothetical protein
MFKNYALLLFALFISLSAFSQGDETASQRYDRLTAEQVEADKTFDGKINSVMAPVTKFIESIVFFTIPISGSEDIKVGTDNSFNGRQLLPGESLLFKDSLVAIIGAGDNPSVTPVILGKEVIVGGETYKFVRPRAKFILSNPASRCLSY